MSLESLPIFLAGLILLFIGLRINSKEPYILKNGHLAVLIAFIYAYVLVLKSGFKASLLDDIVIAVVILISFLKSGSFTVFNVKKQTVNRVIENCLMMYGIPYSSEKSEIVIKDKPDSSFIVKEIIDAVQVIPKKLSKLELNKQIINNIIGQIGRTTSDRFSLTGLLFVLAGLAVPFLWIYIFSEI